MDPRDRPTDQTTEQAGPPVGDAERPIPERFGPYRILDLISSSMALVYKAERDDPRRTVALKIPRAGQLLSEDARRRFLNEVALAATADHAGIVPVLEAGEIDRVPYYTMPFIDGRSLDAFVEIEKPDLARRIDVFRRICAVVQALHEDRLVHRDLKPGNLMIDRHGDVRLLDFGLAKSLSIGPAAVTGPMCMGTPQFMAPEQTLPGGPPVTPAADVHALGAILYWLLTDSLPYRIEGNLQSGVETIRHHTPASPSRRKPGLTRMYDRLVMDCLKKNPARRPRTAGELEKRLAALAGAGGAGVAAPARRLPLVVGLLVIAGIGIAAAVWFGPGRRGMPPGGPPFVAPPVGRIAPGPEVSPPAPDVAAVGTTPAEQPAAASPEGATRPPSDAGTAGAAPDVPRPSVKPPVVQQPDTAVPPPSVPRHLWGLYSSSLSTLRDKFEHRNDGALLLELAEGVAGPVQWKPEGGEWLPLDMPSGGCVIYAGDGETCSFRLGEGDGAREIRATPRRGEVQVVLLAP